MTHPTPQHSEHLWTLVTDAQLAWERDALRAIEADLPDLRPLRVWANFEFMALDGATFDVDLLVFTRTGITLVGLHQLKGLADLGKWTWIEVDDEGHRHAISNPLPELQARADRLRDLISDALSDARCPPIDAVIALNDPTVAVEGPLPPRVVYAPHPELSDAQPSLTDVLRTGQVPGMPHRELDLGGVVFNRFLNAMERVDPGPTDKYRRVGDYRLTLLLDTSPSHQDYQAVHEATGELKRARVFYAPRDSNNARRARLMAAARREYEVLQALNHPNILQVEQLVDLRERPTLLFESPAGTLRLDQLLDTYPNLSAEIRFDLLQKITEAVQYAHRKRVIHRSLSPQSVLVGVRRGEPTDVKLYNWHTSSRADRTQQTGTRHLQAYLEDNSVVYLAPEHVQTPQLDERADVFGLGALAYTLFSGHAPAPDQMALIQVLIDQQGLRLSSVMDSAPRALEELIVAATHPTPRKRLPSVDAFAERLAEARQQALYAEDAPLNPLDAQPGDELGGRFVVTRRLGSGGSAIALLATEPAEDDREVVLKIALERRVAPRLEAEANTLRALKDDLIVALLDVTELAGLRTLVLQPAGDSLRERLRASGRMSLDDLRRFGRDLGQILAALEQQRALHRDIKPDNLGVGTPSGSTQRLMIFDFSLADTPLDALDSGTRAYRDPMLRDRGRWDEAADRYAAAITLHEMATLRLPSWGSRHDPADPLFEPDAPLLIDSDSFPAPIRDHLTAFLTRALHRDPAQRFHNADDFLEAWNAIFARALDSQHTPHALTNTTLDTPLSSLPLSQAARDLLDRLHMITVRDLLNQPPQRISFAVGASGSVRAELSSLRADLDRRLGATADPPLADDRTLSLDNLLGLLLAHSGFDPDLLAELLIPLFGLSPIHTPPREHALPWPDWGRLLDQANLRHHTLAHSRDALAACWAALPLLRPLRADLTRLLERAEGVLADTEVARALLTLRGSTTSDPTGRELLASAVARVALLAELASPEPRVALRRLPGGHTFVSTLSAQPLLDLLPDLGALADLLASEDPLPSPSRVYDELSAELSRAHIHPLSQHRLHTLAALASSSAALSSRLELYPRRMDPRRALKLSAGVLVSGGEPIDDDVLRARVRSRYPDAAPLPDDRIALEQLVREADLPLTRSESGERRFISLHPGAFFSRSSSSALSSINASRPHEADDFDRVLDLRYRLGGFAAFMVQARAASATQRTLTQRFADLTPLSLDRLWIDHVTRVAQQRRVPWAPIFKADQGPLKPVGHPNFTRLLAEAHRAIIDDLCQRAGQRLLLIHPGLLARYAHLGAIDVLEALRARVGASPDAPHAAWLLIPSDEQRLRPTIDGVTVPIVDASSELLRAPRAWAARVEAR